MKIKFINGKWHAVGADDSNKTPVWHVVKDEQIVSFGSASQMIDSISDIGVSKNTIYSKGMQPGDEFTTRAGYKIIHTVIYRIKSPQKGVKK